TRRAVSGFMGCGPRAVGHGVATTRTLPDRPARRNRLPGSARPRAEKSPCRRGRFREYWSSSPAGGLTMTTRGFTAVASRLRKESADDTDRDLLTRFLREQDEAAFEALVRRHERLIRSAVGRVLSDPDDADDAFQATFLVLIRRARSIDWRTGLGPWLYGVAHRVAIKARDAGLARARKEAAAPTRGADPPPDLSWREACALLHAELDRLPDRYRLPLLLCYLDGKTRDEAAAALRVTAQTVKGRLERGREILRTRLAR